MKAGDWAIHYRYNKYDADGNAFELHKCGRLVEYSGEKYFRGPRETWLCFGNYFGDVSKGETKVFTEHSHLGYEGDLYKDQEGNFYTWGELIAKYPSVNCGALAQLSRGIRNHLIKSGSIVVSGWDVGDN